MDIASYIDHTVLKPDTSAAEVEQVCREAVDSGFASVCIPPYYLDMARELLNGSSVKLSTVIGFPFGYSTITAKELEIKDAIAKGADEVDMVCNIAALKAGNWEYLEEEIEDCLRLTRPAGKKLKLIVESGILTDEQLIAACACYSRYAIDFLKTSTGFASIGASVHAVTTMRAHLPLHIGIKASGGIRNFAFAKELIEAGADRIGCSAGMRILEESRTL
jgi:deoxyribose-phosphate aldolase